jgi:hypothetical protein
MYIHIAYLHTYLPAVYCILKKCFVQTKVGETCPGGRRGIVVIASACRTEDLGFESRQGVRLLGIHTLKCCCHNVICIVIACT